VDRLEGNKTIILYKKRNCGRKILSQVILRAKKLSLQDVWISFLLYFREYEIVLLLDATYTIFAQFGEPKLMLTV
jgi:hypothetical protein